MAQDGTLKLSRAQLAKIAQNDPEIIKQLENLFLQSAETNPDDIASLNAQVDNLQLSALAPIVTQFFSVLAGSNISVTQASGIFTIALAAVITGITSLSASGAISGGSVSGGSVSGDMTSTSATKMMVSSNNLTNGAGASAGTITNAPHVGNPDKYLLFTDSSGTYKVPGWT